MQLTFHNATNSPILLDDITISLSYQAEQLTECHLTCHTHSDQYQQIDRHADFNLKPELRSSTAPQFSNHHPIRLTATLKPDYLNQLPSDLTTETIANYFCQLNADHPLLHTENWLALSVSQQQDQTEVGYTTLWKSLNPAAIAAGTLSEADITEALTHFFSDWTTANLGDITDKATTDILTEIGNFFNELADTSLDAISQLTTPDSILSALLQFFTDDDWQFTKLQGEPTLRTAFQGNHGEWFCYAKAREAQQQLIFYSLCPILATADKRNAIAEFLTRANYGMTIGNFELDYSDGEIRYKTSIDVEGDRLTPALIKNLVYTNVTMMDEYIPGIQAVLSGQAPEAAIQAIEQGDRNPSTPHTQATEVQNNYF
jgi:hypothetical protein